MSEIIDQLRNDIKNELSKVTAANSPNVFADIQTAAGYSRVEKAIIEKLLATKLTPAAIIPQMEQESEMM